MNNVNMLRIAMAQMNFTVGDLEGNRAKIQECITKANINTCDLLIFPEMCLTGYPPEDLLLRGKFIEDQLGVLNELASQVENVTCIVGFVDKKKKKIFNAAAVIHNRQIIGIYHKIQLPNYSVFDEERYFKKGATPFILDMNGIKIGISICEDIWVEECVTESLAFCGGAEVLVNISASPYHIGKFDERLNIMRARAQRCRAAVVYNNLVGGQDELVFDGQSMVVDESGRLLQYGAAFEEDFIIYDLNVDNIRAKRAKDTLFEIDKIEFICPFLDISQIKAPLDKLKDKIPVIKQIDRPVLTEADKVYKALILGLRDYVHKNGFKQVVFGLSGGIDSALVAVIAADALGKENVNCVTMPSRFSSRGSVDDSVVLARNLGINLLELPIEEAFNSFLHILEPVFHNTEFNVAEENLQARIRGGIVMALSNKFNWMALATGNKSEVSVGYCTIYGDMVGGFSPLKDVYKKWVYIMSRRCNELAGYDLIPETIINKSPSAELRDNQTDQDSLPPYDVLDAILEMYVENDRSIQEIEDAGYNRKIILDVIRLVDLNEYKRRQAAPGVKITPRAFGKDRRMPITNKYRMK